MTKSSERRLNHLNKAAEELTKLEDEMNKFKSWMVSADKELARQEECLQRFEDLKPLTEKQKVRKRKDVKRFCIGFINTAPYLSKINLETKSSLP